MGNTCTPMADSCQYMAETTTILKKIKNTDGVLGGKLKRDKIYVHLWLSHIVV